MSELRVSEAPDVDAAVRTAVSLERWGTERAWSGTDPYDALNAERVASVVRRWPLAARVVTQCVKRSPLDVRPFLGIPRDTSAATYGILATAYAHNGFLPAQEAAVRLKDATERLEALRCTGFVQPCWGYHFDVQTRVFHYPRTHPNTIATAFAGLGLLDAYERSGLQRALDLAVGAGEFFLCEVPQTPTNRGSYFGYLIDDNTPIHNANMLVSALLARLWCLTGRDDFGDAARAGVAYTVARQRPDGSWPYGERPNLDWIDGFHTGYVLDCLLTCGEAGLLADAASEAWTRGIRFYAEALLESNGTPRYTPTSRYPVDGQCAAQAIQTLARGSRRKPQLAALAWRVFRYAVRWLARPDGAFAFQRRRLWVNRTPHPRWVQAPMLAALAHLIEAGTA